jgi:DnaK suppressor protein
MKESPMSQRDQQPARQPAAGVSIRVHPDSGLDATQAETLYRMLVDKRRQLVEEHRRHLDAGRLPGEQVSESEEAAALDTSLSTLLDLAETERVLLAQIDNALRKFQDGTYGVSSASGEPIGFDRLRAIPWARLSAPDQEEQERLARGRTG